MSKKPKTRKAKKISVNILFPVVVGCILLGMIAILLGLSIYSRVVYRNTIKHAFDVTRHAQLTIYNSTEVISYANRIMDIYHGLSDEQRALIGTPAYKEFFKSIDTTRGSVYSRLNTLLGSFQISDEISDLYLAFYDDETDALVYLVDPAEDNKFFPGEWEPVESREVDKFINWDGRGMLFDVSKTDRYGWMCTAGYPIRDIFGNLALFVLADIDVQDYSDLLGAFALPVSVALISVTALIAWFLSSYLRKNIVKPINEIARAAEDYADDKRKGINNTSRFSQLSIPGSIELGNLCTTMAEMEKTLHEHETNLTRMTAEKERISAELDMATKIQASVLPGTFPAFPDRREFDIYAMMHPAREVGGDFYDFFLIDDDHLGLVIADVSGKGIPAALFMMITKVIVQSCAMLGKGAAEILTKTNEALCSNNKLEFFVTMWVGILEISTGKLTCSNAGHEYPAVKKHDGSFEILHDSHSVFLAGIPEAKYKQYEIQLEPGDKIFVYTDGVTEAENKNNNFFGMDRLVKALRAGEDKAPDIIINTVKKALDGFVRSTDPFDDITMMCLEYKGNK